MKYCLGLLILLSACAQPVPQDSQSVPSSDQSQPSPPPPPAHYPLLTGASPVTAPPPPQINRPLNGFGDLAFGTLAYDAEKEGYTLQIDDDDQDDPGDSDHTYLAGSPTIDGYPYFEKAYTSGTPAQVSNIVLLSGIGGPCPSAQNIFDKLSAKYGPEQTASMNSDLSSDESTNDENTYTWTFEGGRTIQLSDTRGQCPSLAYSEAWAPIKTPNF